MVVVVASTLVVMEEQVAPEVVEVVVLIWNLIGLSVLVELVDAGGGEDGVLGSGSR